MCARSRRRVQRSCSAACRYDYEDKFIDDSEMVEYYAGDRRKAKHTGFFVNTGEIEKVHPLPAPLHGACRVALSLLRPANDLRSAACAASSYAHAQLAGSKPGERHSGCPRQGVRRW